MNELLIAMTIVLTPGSGFLGQLSSVDVCDFAYAPLTVLAPITRINTNPFMEEYGQGSFIPVGSGSDCQPCLVKLITMDAEGVTRIHCETGE